MGRILILRGMQLDVNLDCGCKGVGTVDADVGVFSFCPPPVSQVQKLLREALWGGKSAVATRSRKTRAHLRLLNLCNSQGATCAKKQSRQVSHSSDRISSLTCQDTRWSN